MRDRVAGMINERHEEGFGSAPFTRLRRVFAVMQSWDKSNFCILDQDDRIRSVKQIMEDGKKSTINAGPQAVHAASGSFQRRGLTPDKVGVAEAGDLADGPHRRVVQNISGSAWCP